jgi:hypothetical protein
MYSDTHAISHSIKMCRSERSDCNVTAYRNVAAYRNVLYCAQGAIKIICIVAHLPYQRIAPPLFLTKSRVRSGQERKLLWMVLCSTAKYRRCTNFSKA